MNTKIHQSRRAPQRGITLIIVLILTIVIGLTAAAAMRGATSSQQVTNNVRMDNMAQQYAEAALRYCESQLLLDTGDRINTLRTPVLPTVDMTVPGTTGAWENTVSWTGGIGAGAAASTRTVLQPGFYSSGTSSYLPSRAPECVAEIQTLPGVTPFTVTVVTARGFSTDYQFNASTGFTTKGSVVWLQSILNL